MLKERLGDSFTPHELAVGLIRVERRVERRRKARRALWLSVPIVALVVVLAGAATFWPPPDVGPLTAAGGEPLARSIAPGRADFADGSTVELTPGGQLSLLQNEHASVDFQLRRGHARFDIRPGGPRRWSVRAGPLVVRVLGTSFSVDHDGDLVSVTVHRGVVEVEASGESRRLYAGERFAIGGDRDRWDPLAARPSAREPEGAPSEPIRSGSAPRSEGDGDLARPASEVLAEPQAQRHVAVGEGSRERRAAESTERAGTDRRPPGAAAADLLRRSDEARRRGELATAAEALERLISRHPEAPEAGSAAASLGRLEQGRGRIDAAARAYARALELTPPPALAELVYERLVRLELDRGRRDAAVGWAAAHHQAFPHGARTASIDAALATP